MDIQTDKQEQKTGYSIRAVIAVGFALSLSMGFVDVLISIMSGRPSGLSSFSSLLPPVTATVVFFFLVYLILWFLIVSHLEYFLRLGAIPLAVSLALVLGLFFILPLLKDLIGSYLSPAGISKFAAISLVYLLIAVGVYFITKAITQASGYKNITAALGIAFPFILAATTLLVWLCVFHIKSFASLTAISAFAVYILIVVFTFLLFYRAENNGRAVGLLAVFMALVVLSPFMESAKKRLFSQFANPDREIRHVILITVDTLRADVLSSYDGEQSVPTPHIDKLAGDGILFTNAISSAPWTLPSFSSIMTGLSPLVHKTTKSTSKLPDNLKTLAEYMRDAGYFTAGIGYNPFLKPSFNLSQGFIEYNFFPKSSIGNSFGAGLLKRFFLDRFRQEASTQDLTRLAANWLRANREKDFFLWLHYYDPHVPYAPPQRYLPKEDSPPGMGNRFNIKNGKLRDGRYVPPPDKREWIKKLYDAEVRYVDDNIGRIIRNLKALKLYDESLIVLTSDHGEEFWDHGGFEHGHTLYNELIRVPLIIKLPESALKKRIDMEVPTQSVMPTILDACGIDYGSDHLYVNYVNSLSPLWGRNPGDFYEQPIVSTGLLYFENREAVVFDGLKYIRFLKTNREELYDLDRDPGEQFSISNFSPDKIEKAKSILREKVEVAGKLEEHYDLDVEEIKLDKDTKKSLKNLGYLQ